MNWSNTAVNQEPEISPSDSDSYVRYENVQKTYDGDLLVVKNLNLDVPKGEFLTLLGPSGSGKTTTLMMLAGFESPTRGQILLDGRALNRVPPHKRNIGMVFQNYALFPHMSVEENLAFPLKIRKISEAEITRKVTSALDMVHLKQYANRRPLQLSGGQQQRVAVARALVFEPAIVLMDEPLGALDKKLREELQYEIKSLHDRLGITMLYVTHDQSEALTMSDRIAVFDDGEVQQCGSPKTLYEEPVNRFVAEFIGENNRLEGRVTEVDDDYCTVSLASGEGEVRALRVDSLSAGDACLLSLRPEHIQLSASSSDPASNSFEGQVQGLLFQGDHLRAKVSACGTDSLIIKIPNTGNFDSLVSDGKVRVGWSAGLCRAFSVS